MRTYTVRAARPSAREIDVDLVLHGASGPASAWAERAAVGDEVALVGPDARFDGAAGGFEWHPPAAPSCVLLAGDETAVPAIGAIVESLPAGSPARVFLEVPTAADILPLTLPAGVELTWLPRRTGAAGTPAPHGARLTEAVVRAAAEFPGVARRPQERPDDGDVDTEIVWEVPPTASAVSGPYAWLAGEAGVITGLRRLLVRETGLDRRSVAFMGYWRAGRSGT
jgi:NADPH-dependent ferric siderophore reductase